MSHQHGSRLECRSRHWWLVVHCLWHKLTGSSLAIALMKKPGAILAGWSRKYFRSLSCSCSVSVLPGFCILWGKKKITCGLKFLLMSVNFLVLLCFHPEKLSVNSLANQLPFFNVLNQGVLAICILAVFVNQRIPSARKELPGCADCSPWSQKV